MHRNVEVTYRPVSRRCTEKTKNFVQNEIEKKQNERDDIQEECCEFVRHLLWRYISKQNDDHAIDKALNSISSFRSSESVVRSTNPKRTNEIDRISFLCRVLRENDCRVISNTREMHEIPTDNILSLWNDSASLLLNNKRKIWIFDRFCLFYLLKFWLSIRIFVKALKCSGSNITGILTFSNSWVWRRKNKWQIIDVIDGTEKLTLHIKTESNGSLARNNLCFWCRTLNFDFVLILCPSIDVIGRSKNWQKEREREKKRKKSISLFFAFAFNKW